MNRLNRLNMNLREIRSSSPIPVKSDTEEEEEQLNNEIYTLKCALRRKYQRLTEIRIRRVKRKTEAEVRARIRRETRYLLPSLRDVARTEERGRRQGDNIVREILNNISSEEEQSANDADEEDCLCLSGSQLLKKLIDEENLENVD